MDSPSSTELMSSFIILAPSACKVAHQIQAPSCMLPFRQAGTPAFRDSCIICLLSCLNTVAAKFPAATNNLSTKGLTPPPSLLVS